MGKVWGTRSAVMGTRSAHALLVLVVMVMTLRTTSAQNVCSLDLTSENCFEPSGDAQEDKQGKTHAEVHDVSFGSCDFSEGMCEYSTHGCRQQNGVTKEWTHNASGFLETTFNGGNGRNGSGNDATSPTLSSPLLHIPVASCLTFTASTAPSSQLAVWLHSEDKRTCPLAVKNTTSLDSVEVFRLNLPVTVRKVMFQGFGKEEGDHSVRLYSVSILSECCVDEDWSTFYSRRASSDSVLSPHCHWEMRGWNSSTGRTWATAFARTTKDTLTSPVLSGNGSPGGHFGCFSFQYLLEARAGARVALSVSLLTGRSGQDEMVKWLVNNNSTVSEGTFGFNNTGQLPVSLSQPFRIRFTVRSERDVDPRPPLVFVNNVTYTRGRLAPCPYEPLWAERSTGSSGPPAVTLSRETAGGGWTEGIFLTSLPYDLHRHARTLESKQSDSHSNKVVIGSIAGGTSAGLIIVIVVAVCLCMRWRKTQRGAAKVKASVPMVDILQPERPLSFNPYTEIAATADSAPTAHDHGSVSGNAVTSVHDVTTSSDRTESDPDHSSSDLVNPGTKEISNEDSSVDPRHQQSNEKSTPPRSQTEENGEAKATNDHTTDESQNHETPETNGSNKACATKASTKSEHHYHVLEIDSENTLATQKLKTDSELETGSETNNKLGDEPETENGDKAGGRAERSSTVYDRLGDIKGGDSVKASEGTLNVYDRVGVLNESVYDVAQRSRRIDIIDSTYHRLDHVPKGKSA